MQALAAQALAVWALAAQALAAQGLAAHALPGQHLPAKPKALAASAKQALACKNLLNSEVSSQKPYKF